MVPGVHLLPAFFPVGIGPSSWGVSDLPWIVLDWICCCSCYPKHKGFESSLKKIFQPQTTIGLLPVLGNDVFQKITNLQYAARRGAFVCLANFMLPQRWYWGYDPASQGSLIHVIAKKLSVFRFKELISANSQIPESENQTLRRAFIYPLSKLISSLFVSS